MSEEEKNKFLDRMVAELSDVQSYADSVIDIQNGDLVSIRLTEVGAYIARTGMLYAQCVEMQERNMKDICTKEIDFIKTLSPSIAKSYISASCYEFNHLVNWAERLNAALTHQGDHLMTQLSYEKKQLEMVQKIR